MEVDCVGVVYGSSSGGFVVGDLVSRRWRGIC